MKTCIFCAIAVGEAPAAIVREWDDALAVRPRSGGVNPGHVFVLPRVHVEDAGTDPEVTAAAVLGCPPDCPNPERNRYLIYVARRHGVPVCETLPDAAVAALALVGAR
ncbi:HIT family protein [Streptomyces californicus]|uniref:HIT family protein n=1 Tax=Streptomyces californicus TaxID=67351 RepID=UPI003791366B